MRGRACNDAGMTERRGDCEFLARLREETKAVRLGLNHHNEETSWHANNGYCSPLKIRSSS